MEIYRFFHKGSFEVQSESHHWVLWWLCFLSLCFPVSLAARLTPSCTVLQHWWGEVPASCKVLASQGGETNEASCLRVVREVKPMKLLP